MYASDALIRRVSITVYVDIDVQTDSMFVHTCMHLTARVSRNLKTSKPASRNVSMSANESIQCYLHASTTGTCSICTASARQHMQQNAGPAK